MNTQLFHAINNLAGRMHWVDVLGIFFSDKFLYVFGIIILALWLDKKLRINVYLAFASAFISRVVIVEAIKRIVNHPRPYEIVANIHQLLPDSEHGMSFPSGHAVIFFTFAFAFWNTKYFWPFFVLGLLGSLARIFVGVHFPADILGSFIIAWATVWAIRIFLKKKLTNPVIE